MRKRSTRRTATRSAPKKTVSSAFKPNRHIGLFFVMLNVLFWGLAPAIIKHGLDIVSPQVFLYYRFVIVIALSTPFLFIFRKKFNSISTPSQLLTLLLIGFVANPLSLSMLFFGLQYTTSSAASIIAATSPLFIIIASAIFLKEKITKNEILGAILASLGTMVIVLETPIQTQASNPLLGNTIILLYNIVWAGVVLVMKKLANAHSPFVFGYTGWLMGMIVMGLVTLKTEPQFFFRPLMLLEMTQALWPIVYMAIFGSIIAFTSYQIAQKHLPASEVSIFTYLQPVVAVPLSLLWLHERFGVLSTVGLGVLIAGVVLAELHSSSRVKRLLHGSGYGNSQKR